MQNCNAEMQKTAGKKNKTKPQGNYIPSEKFDN